MRSGHGPCQVSVLHPPQAALLLGVLLHTPGSASLEHPIELGTYRIRREAVPMPFYVRVCAHVVVCECVVCAHLYDILSLYSINTVSVRVVLPQTAKFRYIRRDGGATSPLPDGAALLPYITFAASRPHHLAHRESLCGVREGAPRGEERVEYLSHELRTSRVAPACAPCVSPEPSETLAVGVAGPVPSNK